MGLTKVDEQSKTLDIQTERNYGIDVLRIISMLMVVILHVLGRGGVLSALDPFSLKYDIAWLLEIAAYGAVDCYALISGYVGVFAKHKYGGLAILWLRVVFYSFSLTIVDKLMGVNHVGMGRVLSSVFPVFTNKYWYFTCYFILFLFIPILNRCIKVLSKKTLQVFFVSVFICFSVLAPVMCNFGGNMYIGNGYSPLWLIVLYLLGGYIRKYGLLIKTKKRFLILFFLISVILTWSSKIFIQLTTVHLFGNIQYDDTFVTYNSITVLSSAIALLLLFSRIKLNNSVVLHIVSFLSPLAFSVYLIHEHYFVKGLFITNKLVWITQLPTIAIIPVVLGCAIGIYTICSVIDSARMYLFKLLRIKMLFSSIEERLRTKFRIKG